MLKLLVTGGCGFIGSNFVLHMLRSRRDVRVVNLDKLTCAWRTLVFRVHPGILRVGGMPVLVGDGIKVAKSGRKMPAVKKLHQQSESNSKPDSYIHICPDRHPDTHPYSHTHADSHRYSHKYTDTNFRSFANTSPAHCYKHTGSCTNSFTDKNALANCHPSYANSNQDPLADCHSTHENTDHYSPTITDAFSLRFYAGSFVVSNSVQGSPSSINIRIGFSDMIEISPNWISLYPGAALGILSMRNARAQGKSTKLDDKRESLERGLRERYRSVDRQQILNSNEMAAYAAYYKRFKKTYHLLLQLESVAKKNKPIPQTIPLVQAVFMAEMNSFLLTAGHDLERIIGSINLDISKGDEIYTPLRGENVTCKPGDMVMADSQSVICSVIRGQDQRTMITKNTDHVLYVVYVPPGISANVIEEHLTDLAENVNLVSPQAQIDFQHIYFAKHHPQDAE